MGRIVKRLEATERVTKPQLRGARMVIGEYGETEADLDARRDRMIAEGNAVPDDGLPQIENESGSQQLKDCGNPVIDLYVNSR